MSDYRIGVAAGVGPAAGIELLKRIVEETAADCDQEHLDVIALIRPGEIPDRTRYLRDLVKKSEAGKIFGASAARPPGDVPAMINPGDAIASQLLELEAAGVRIAAVPCNTAHAEPILTVILSRLAAAGSRLKFVNIIEETAAYIMETFSRIKRIGVLSTTGTRDSGVYTKALERAGFHCVVSTNMEQEGLVQPAIYDAGYGLKAKSPPSERARQDLLEASAKLIERGAEAIVLGCTEIPLALTEKFLDDVPIIDAVRVLARALIREAAPEKLKPDRHV